MVFSTVLYIQVRLNRVIVRNARTGQTVDILSQQPFSHPRTLVGDFSIAESVIKKALSQVKDKGLILSTKAVIHPLENIEGGVTQIEERVFKELLLGAGVSKVVLWEGELLTDEEVISKL